MNIILKTKKRSPNQTDEVSKSYEREKFEPFSNKGKKKKIVKIINLEKVYSNASHRFKKDRIIHRF